jgi:hypothetical protein
MRDNPAFCLSSECECRNYSRSQQAGYGNAVNLRNPDVRSRLNWSITDRPFAVACLNSPDVGPFIGMKPSDSAGVLSPLRRMLNAARED